MPEFWELDEAALWGEVDAAWLLEQFRRNEISEERAHRQALLEAQPDRFLTELVEMAWAYTRAVQAAILASCDLTPYLIAMVPPACLEAHDPGPRVLVAPPTWVAVPERCVTQSRLRLYHARCTSPRPGRGPATRRR